MLRSVLCLLLLAYTTSVSAFDLVAGDRLTATGGVTQIEGSAGGGLVPWALIAGLGTRDQIGFTAFYTRTDPTDFTLDSKGFAIGLFDRLEASFAQQRLGLGNTVPGQIIRQDIAGLKLKLTGDAVFDADRWLPQLALGAQYKHNEDFALVPKALGAKRGDDVDIYLAATKLYFAALLGRNLLADVTLRGTRANQMGLLGFGGDRNDGYRPQIEGSLELFLTDRVIFGGEYRMKPNNLSAFTESDYRDLHLAWLPSKRLALICAHAWLGTIADRDSQHALYLSSQIAF